MWSFYQVKKRELKVLLVDDDPGQIALALAAIRKVNVQLSSNNKIYTEIVRDGQGALDRVRKGGIDLVLLDLRMPKMDGFEVLRAIKFDLKLRKIPVVILTTSDLDTDIDAAMSSYANAYLVKPIDHESLVAVMGHLKNFWSSSEIVS